MIKRNYKNWTINTETKSLLFFAQRLDEALFHYTSEKYKSPVLYSSSSCLEVLETISQYEKNIWPFKTIETVYAEFKSIFLKDDTAKTLVGDIYKYYLLDLKDNNLNKIKSNLELLYLKIKPIKYFQHVKSQLISEISSTKKNIEIEKLIYRLIASLTDIGYSQEHIYYISSQFFFKNTRIDSVSILYDFFNLFDLGINEYDIYMKVNSLFQQIEEACKRFNIEIVSKEAITLESQKKIELTNSSVLVKINNIKAYDPHSAKRIANVTLAKICDLFTFFHHKQRIVSGDMAVVFNKNAKTEVILPNKISAMSKGFDFYPKVAAYRLDEMLRKFDLEPNSLIRFNRSIDIHGVAIDNIYPENQLQNNWTAIESLIGNNKKDSIINNILSSLIPILNFEYNKRIFINLATDIERTKDKNLISIINKVDVGDKLYEKLAALVTITKYLPISKELFNSQEEFPLLNYRIFWLNKHLKNPKSVAEFINIHTEKVEWHIRRIYRARNLIIHAGKIPKSIERLVESSHSYLDDLLNIIMSLSVNGQQIQTIEHAVDEIIIRNKMHKDYLNQNKDTEYNKTNYINILWGEYI